MTYNIRWDDGEKSPWSHRQNLVASILRYHRPDIIALQEPFAFQLEDLSLPEYECHQGTGLKSAGDQLAYNPIFFRKARFALISSGFFYLSSTPELPSLGWGAEIERGVSWVQLKDKTSGDEFFVFNAHLDYHSLVARLESARLLRSKIRATAGNKSVVLTGDFNLFPGLGDEEALQILTENSDLTDAFQASTTPHHGPTGSWSGFREPGQPGVRPDRLFVDASWKVLSHAILADSFDGEYPSDHLPVVSDLILCTE